MDTKPETDAEAIAALDAWDGLNAPWGMTMQRQMRKALDAASAWRKARADAMPWPDTYPMPAHGWTCFHCGETFTTPGSARDHFGCEPRADPACRIKVGAQRGLVRALRKAEKELARYRVEDSDADRRYYAQQADHAQALIREEEKGYARGMADFREHELPKAVETALTARAQPALGLADDARKIVDALVFIKARTNGIAERTQEFVSHDNACAAVKLAAATLPLAESLAGKIEALRAWGAGQSCNAEILRLKLESIESGDAEMSLRAQAQDAINQQSMRAEAAESQLAKRDAEVVEPGKGDKDA